MANTRITQGVIKPNEDYDVRHINATGIITAQNISIGGTLTYNDVTSVDSIGIITARKGIVSSGVVTASAFHGDGSQLTGISVDATSIEGPGGGIVIQGYDTGAVHTGFSTMQNLRGTGIATFGTSSTVIHGDQNLINVGTALTLGHTQGVQFHTQNLHADGFEINNINASGIITAAQFSGGGSDLSGLPVAIGTALGAAGSGLDAFFYVNKVLGVDSTVTVDPPSSSDRAYTHYTDIQVDNGGDLIIAEGDDLIPDVLGLANNGTFGGGASAGRLRVNIISDKNATGAPTVSNGLIISGVTTTSEIFVGNNIKLDPISGIVTATTFSGNLTGGATALKDSAGNVKIQAQASGAIHSGISTFSNVSILYGNNGVLKLKRSNTTNQEAHIGYFSSGLHIETRELTNIELKSNTQTKLLVNPSGAVVTGILTATSFSGDGSALTGVSSPSANRNFIINGDMRFWQRGTTFNSQGNGQNDYTTDRFAIGHNNSHMAAVTQQDGTGAHAKFQYCARVQRDSGQSQTDQMRFHTALETNDVILLRGEVLTISYYARKGANYSEANSKITGVRIATGENIDGDPNAYSGGHWTNATTILTGTPTLTTSWQRFSHTTSAVSNSANSMIIEFRHSPTGTAGANDYYEITGVQLEIGSSMTAFEHRRYTDELQRCQRFYEIVRAGGGMYWGNGQYCGHGNFKVTKRSAPAVTIQTEHYDYPSSGNWTAINITTEGFGVRNNTSGSYQIVDGTWTANAEL